MMPSVRFPYGVELRRGVDLLEKEGNSAVMAGGEEGSDTLGERRTLGVETERESREVG